MLTYYNDRTGERTELSALSLGNWAAKTANFFRDELGLTQGDAILVDLPEHWQTAAILLGAWWAGVDVVTPHTVTPNSVAPDHDADDVRVVITSAGRVDAYPNAEETVVASLDPFGAALPGLPIGVIDYGPSVRIHSDNFTPSADATTPLPGRSSAQVVEEARSTAAVVGIATGSRIMNTRGWREPAEIIENLLAPLLVGASLIAVADPDETKLAARAETERADVTRG